jgi:hypothetical protein
MLSPAQTFKNLLPYKVYPSNFLFKYEYLYMALINFSTVFLEMLIVAWLIKKFPAFYVTQKFIVMFV